MAKIDMHASGVAEMPGPVVKHSFDIKVVDRHATAVKFSMSAARGWLEKYGAHTHICGELDWTLRKRGATPGIEQTPGETLIFESLINPTGPPSSLAPPAAPRRSP